MGCGNSRTHATVSESPEWDTLLGLTDRQKQIIRDSWVLIKKDMLVTGLDIFSIFFKREDRETIKLFPKVFQNNDDNTIMNTNDGNLQYHVMLVMKGIGTVVDKLDYPQSITNYLNYVGQRHLQCHVQPYMLERLWPAIDEGFSSLLVDVYTEELRTAWRTLIYFMIKRMQLIMEEVENSNSNIHHPNDSVKHNGSNTADKMSSILIEQTNGMTTH